MAVFCWFVTCRGEQIMLARVWVSKSIEHYASIIGKNKIIDHIEGVVYQGNMDMADDRCDSISLNFYNPLRYESNNEHNRYIFKHNR